MKRLAVCTLIATVLVIGVIALASRSAEPDVSCAEFGRKAVEIATSAPDSPLRGTQLLTEDVRADALAEGIRRCEEHDPPQEMRRCMQKADTYKAYMACGATHSP